MAKLADALALGASGATHGSSNLPPSTLDGTRTAQTGCRKA